MLLLNPYKTALQAQFVGLSTFNSERRRLRSGVCGGTCDQDRTDATDLPWDPDKDYGGWGGHEYHATDPGVSNTPVIFVHGSKRDACDWDLHVDDLQSRGYTGDELWAINFQNETESHLAMADQLDEFVTQVRNETGVDEVAIIAHSLGVTGVRHWLDSRDRYDWITTFIGVAGPNHGLMTAKLANQLDLETGQYRFSYWLRNDYNTIPDHPLAQLNEDTETPGEDISYYTIRGSQDGLFAGCKESPRLEGAEENVELPVGHEGTRFAPQARQLIYSWLPD